MKVAHKIIIDRLVGQPLAWGMNLAARVLGKLMRRDHSCAPQSVRTIVISKYLGMGSIIQATPFIRSVHARYPEARIIFLTGRECVKLAERLEYIDEILVIDDRTLLTVCLSSLRAVRTMMRRKVDLFFDLEIYSFYASLMALLSLARNRIGFFRQSAEHRRGNYTHLVYFNTHFPLRYVYLQLARLIGCPAVEPDTLGKLHVDEKDRYTVIDKLRRMGLPDKSYILVTPNTSEFGTERRWPPERFAAVIGRVVQETHYHVILPGIASEHALNQTVVHHVPTSGQAHVSNLAGALSIGEFLALMEKAAAIITNDTGPMHMAWAMGIPTVSLFGMCSPAKYGWNSSHSVSLYHPVYCSPCVHEIDIPPCRGDNVCMQRIQIEEVVAALHALLNGTLAISSMAVKPEIFSTPEGEALGKVVPLRAYPEAR